MKWEKFPFKIEKQYRLGGWDYSANGYYFVTICTKDRVNYFGEIINNEFVISNIGYLVEKYWNEIPKHFENVELDKFVVMPNHFHGMLIINNHKNGGGRNMPWHVPTKNNDNDTNPPWHVPTKMLNEFGKPISTSLSMIINGFKGSVKRECNKNGIKFNWQSRFHDRLIRNEKELWAKRIYIENNSENWGKDKNNF